LEIYGGHASAEVQLRIEITHPFDNFDWSVLKASRWVSSHRDKPAQMKVAVVGSGVSGLAAAWALNEYSDHEIHLYEADDRPGGHANTVTFRRPDIEDSPGVDVDT
jgi:hypothetical protein